MPSGLNKVLFLLFLISGFCGLLYQVVWVRMAFASFGIITPVLSVVISVFMLGLSLGSWIGGKWISRLAKKTGISAIIFYALIEVLIGIGAFAVPRLFLIGETHLFPFGEMDSFNYLFFSALTIGGSILPWCIFMGTTFPFMMSFIKEIDKSNATGFSFLYLANVIGAMCGTLTTAIVLIELLGFSNTLLVGAALNFSIAGISIGLGIRYPFRANSLPAASKNILDKKTTVHIREKTAIILIVLFTTGFVSMSMEVVWIRAFTPVLKTTVYAFASILFVYLLGTWIGSYIYRKDIIRNNTLPTKKLIIFLAVCALLPILLNDVRINLRPVGVLVTIFPFCTVLGYLTPKLIDEYSMGNPQGGGKAYAVNILGSIIGPVFASYVLLPLLGAKLSLILLSIPFLIFQITFYKTSLLSMGWNMRMGSLVLTLMFVSTFFNISFEEQFHKKGVIHRDHTATVISFGDGMKKRLLVNGIGTTLLHPITKVMAHMPLAFYQGKPESALVICFGMGTTFRSLLSWDIKSTAVELVPSVKNSFGYYFGDAESVLKNPNGRIIIDDGRRFLKRTTEIFDVITLDPPPPIETAGSSLLYSKEFYDLAKIRLSKGGILQQWFPGGELKILQAATRSLVDVFPYVRVYPSLSGWGIHFIGSKSPIKNLTVDEMIERLPDTAQNDLMEWNTHIGFRKFVSMILSKEIPVSELLNNDKNIFITDDKPFNEYFALRRLWDGLKIVE
tara:strand:- start:383 stop:2575 length:2193 start_codon:yes stop_codon:yes gene_type:complete